MQEKWDKAVMKMIIDILSNKKILSSLSDDNLQFKNTKDEDRLLFSLQQKQKQNQELYLNIESSLTKMQSINQLNRSSERQSELPPTQTGLYQIFPKELLSDEIYIQSIHDFNEPMPSINELPKFVSGKHFQQSGTSKQQPNFQMINFLLTTKHAQFVIDSKIKTQHIIYEKQAESRSIVILLKCIIWLCYFLSTAQNTFEKITVLHFIDFTGVGIACSLVLVHLFKKREADLQHAIHLLSLVSTLTLHFYPSQDSFTWFLLVIRSLRLFFPLNFNHGFKNIILKYGAIVGKIFKACVPLLFMVTLFSLILITGSSNSIFNRCRSATSIGIITTPVDQMLCGSRQCPANQECLNPLLYKMEPNKEEYQFSSVLGYGFFLFSNLYRSLFTVISLGSLSQSAHIIDIYINALPGYWLAFCSMSALISIQFGLIPILVIIIESTLQQEHKREDDTESIINEFRQPGQPQGDPAQRSLSEGFSAAPTFGIIKNERKKSNQRLPSSESQRANSINNFTKSQSSKPIKVQQIKEQVLEQSAQSEKQSSSTIQKAITYFISILYAVLALAQFLLTIVYAFKLTEQAENRTIGIGLMCFFVVWTFKILLSVFDKYFDEQSSEETEQQSISMDNQELIFKIEVFIYTVHLLDYICRIMQHVYIMEDISVITPLSAASLILRILYIPLARKKTSSFINQIKIFAKIQNSIIIYILFMVAVSSLFAVLSRGHSDEPFTVQAVKHFTALGNSNWVEVYRDLSFVSTQKHTSGLRFAIKFFLVLVGQLLMLRFIYAESISVAILNIRKNDIEIPEAEILETPSNEEVLSELKSQKSLFLFEYGQNSLRESLHKIIQRVTYKRFKQKLIGSYVLISYFGEIILKKSEIFIYSLMTISCLLLTDAFFSIIALRFWGKHSFTNYNWYQLINFIISFIIIANAIDPFMDISFMRVFRVMLLLSFSIHLKESYRLIVNFIKIFVKILPFFVILWGFFTVMCICISVENHEGVSQVSFIMKSLAFGLQMFKNGFDLPSSLSFSNDYSKLFAFQSSLLSLMIGIPVNSLCIMLILKYLQEQKKQKEQKNIKQIIVNSNNLLNQHEAEQKMEIESTKEQILGIVPQIKPEGFLQKGYLLKLISTKAYQYFGFFVCTIGLVLVLFITLFCTTVSGDILFYFKLAKIFFFLIEISLFAVQCVAFEATTSNFKLNLTLYMLSTPGHFLIMVPFDQLLVSKQLQQLLFLLVSFTPIALINYFLGNNCQYTSVFYFIYRKIHRTFWLLLFALTICWLFASMLTIFLQEEMVVLMSKLLIGFLGGPFERFIDLKSLQTEDTVAVYLLISIFNLLAFPIRNGIIAMFLFEISDTIRHTMSYKTSSHVITRQTFKEQFNESKFIELWSRLDPKGTGLVTYSVLFHNLFNILKTFKLYKRYLSFIVATKAQIFNLKLELFRELSIPIRTVNIMDSDGKKHTQYMITIYDVIGRFFCLALSEDEQSTSEGEERLNSKIAAIMGLDSTQWSQSIISRIVEFNKIRKQERQIDEKFIVLKHIEMESKVLSTIIKIFPALRRRIELARQKIKGQ